MMTTSYTHGVDTPLKQAVLAAANFNNLDSDGFNENLAIIQAILGEDDGGYAAVYFDLHWNTWVTLSVEARVKIIHSYIEYQLNMLW